MIAITAQMRLLVAVEPVDFRKGIDGLVAVCRQKLQAEPFGGALFIFGSRNRKSIKIPAYLRYSRLGARYGNYIYFFFETIHDFGCLIGEQQTLVR